MAYQGSGYNSDEDVYATAKAIDRGVDVEYDEDDNPIVVRRGREVEGRGRWREEESE